MATIDSNAIIQVAIVVRDIEKAAAAYASLFGLEMPEIRNAFPSITYRGERVKTKALLCAFPMGGVVLELVQPDAVETSWKEYLDAHGEGVHHIGVMVEDLDGAKAAMAEHGAGTRQFGGAGWGSYSVMDTEALLGVNFSLKCNTPVVEES
ncbi:VOC family protein [Eubacteriales bacterium OttesenSCG-928-A19]|nr:VOC family protein [Eubacteriales bacterium OttesenSCG-928-A19]